MPGKILIVDDEQSMREFLQIFLSKEGYEVETANSGAEAIKKTMANGYDLIIADMMMPQMTGLDLLKEIKYHRDDQDFVIMTAFASVDTAIEAMKEGALDYISKPFVTDSTILVRGESGTGKDLIARAIHSGSERATGPFVTINCAALPETLLESELFGYKKGAFTGAIKDKDGLFKMANGGTFFLDEVGNTSPAIQMKLLRVLDDKIITPVGDTKPIEIDVRLIAATNADLEEEVKANHFRSDLFYRLNVIPIYIPALRERVEDIPLLVNHFVAKYCRRNGMETKTLSSEAIKTLNTYSWPGNVRELENCLERAVLLSRKETIELSDFPEKLF
ncbi:MAG: sigma-54 dependent transcriptional regulator, partial [candidate division Zixibacteria bacterium]|nr:sigma-54 dependent transcriptional regulator [candidate division Zixibacteria bacterium]